MRPEWGACVPRSTAASERCRRQSEQVWGPWQAVGEQLRTSTGVGVCFVVFCMNQFLHQEKLSDNMEVIGELGASLADRQRLLRSAFDATCYVKVEGLTERCQPCSGPLRSLLEHQGAVLAGTLRVSTSSREMDELCCRAMAGQLLDRHRISSGLADLTELVMRAPSARDEDLHLSRTMITCRDDTGLEFDTEVRVVPSGDESGHVVCGFRCIGEKRPPVQDNQQPDVDEAAERGIGEIPTSTVAVQDTVRMALWPRLCSCLVAFWQFLRATPQPILRLTEDPLLLAQVPVSQAVWRALRCIEKVLMVRPKPQTDMKTSPQSVLT